MKHRIGILLLFTFFTINVYGQDKLPVYVVSRDYGMAAFSLFLAMIR